MKKTIDRSAVTSSENWIKDLCRDKENSSHVMSEKVLNEIVGRFEDYVRDFGTAGSCSYTILKAFAADIGMSPIKVRKILITTGLYENEKSIMVGKLYHNGKNIEEIQEITGLKRATVYSYLPYLTVKESGDSTIRKHE